MSNKKKKPLNPVDTTAKVWQYDSVQCIKFEKLDDESREEIKRHSVELIEQLKEMGVIPSDSETIYENSIKDEVDSYETAEEMARGALMTDISSPSFTDGISDQTGKRTLKDTVMSILTLEDGSCYYYTGQANKPYNEIVN